MNSQPTFDDLISVCNRAARAGAREIMAMRGQFDVREKGPADLVTDADLASEKAVRRVVKEAFPSHVVLGEEQGAEEGADGAEYQWVVDPIDGTSNYVHDLPFYCVSLAVRRGGRSIVGTVLDPVRDELFSAADRRGATLNGQPITVHPRCPLSESLLAISLPPKLEGHSREIAQLATLAPLCRAFRRLGAAALILAYLAAGRIDGYWATQINVWDRAAGELLVREAGGVVTDIDGQPLTNDRSSLLATGTPELHEQMHALLSATDGKRDASGGTP